MDVQELEARLQEIDDRSKSGNVEVSVEGGAESSGRLTVSVTRKVAGDDVNKDLPGAPPTSLERETLLDIGEDDVDVPDDYVKREVVKTFEKKGRVGQLDGVTVRQIGATADYEVVDDYTYNAGDYRITAKKGFVYNRSSVPRILWVIISKDDLSNVAPLIHDLIYHFRGHLPADQVSPYRTFKREDADDLFLELMKKSGVKSWRAKLAHRAVRRFGMVAWKD